MDKGLRSVSLQKDGAMNILRFEIPHIQDGVKKDGISVVMNADETTPTHLWMAKIQDACFSVAALIESKGLDKGNG